MPPEPMEIKRGLALWLRESSLAPELALSQALALAGALRLFFLEDSWMIMLQLHFPTDSILYGKELLY